MLAPAPGRSEHDFIESHNWASDFPGRADFYPDRDEVRLTDAPLSTGSTVEIAGETWTVTLDRDPTDMAATARFLCELTNSQRERAERMQAFNRDMRERMLAQGDAPCSPGGTRYRTPTSG